MFVTANTPSIEYRVLSKKGEGTFSEVIKAQRISDGVFCAIKRMKQKMHRSAWRPSVCDPVMSSSNPLDALLEHVL